MKKFVIIVFAMVLADWTAQAASITWNVAGSGNWDTNTANWVGDSTTFTDNSTVDVTFNNIAGGTITISANMTPQSTTVSASSGTYTFTGGPIDGTGSLSKSGGGTLILSGANNFSGGTVINAGTVAVKADANLGATGTGITFNGSAALSFGNYPATGALTVDLGTRPITINNGAIAGLYHNWADTTITIGGAVTGDGGIIWGRDPVLTYGGGSGSVRLNLNSTGNTFTGPLTVGTGNDNAQGGGCTFSFSSLGDSTNPITFNFQYPVACNFNAAGPISNLSLPNRPINLLTSSATINNQNATYTMTFGAVSTTTGGGKTLNIGNAGSGCTIAGAITDGNGQISVAKSGTGSLYLSGTNKYTGTTTVSGGKLILSNAWSVASGNLAVTSAKVRLDYVGTRAVAGLTLGGASQGPGVYNSANFGTYIEGVGNLITGIQTFSVTYNCTNATGGTVPVDWNAYTNGQEVTVMGTGTLYRTSYRLGFWCTQADGGGVNYLPGSTFTLTTNTTLYAKWPSKGMVIVIR